MGLNKLKTARRLLKRLIAFEESILDGERFGDGTFADDEETQAIVGESQRNILQARRLLKNIDAELMEIKGDCA